ncbi:MAG TPA: hypothetical protein VF451_05385 [Acidobacteriota bacterium]
MIKHKKMIAAFVVFTFLSLLQISAMPRPAEQSPGQAGTSMTSSEKAPNFIEEEGTTGYQPRKKSMLPIILGVVVVGAVVAVLVLVVLKTKYDITGQWTLTWKYEGETENSNTITFTGDKKTGTFAIGSANGTYTASDKNVSWTYAGGDTVYTGKFTDKTHMSGTQVSFGTPGTWSAVKLASSTGFGTTATADRNANGKKQQ